jgi:hypothetical protein
MESGDVCGEVQEVDEGANAHTVNSKSSLSLNSLTDVRLPLRRKEDIK